LKKEGSMSRAGRIETLVILFIILAVLIGIIIL